ncbi:hypothetical protein [Leucothrix arctica]|uniref:Uncharacterized protein n=1 Tax=Leucothrix arctica TaxID=1481894 RepID=A0A317CMF8_9GAMM|nr:hypothetical protein [Leucothrix arctica]PWQ97502.1 hypothetical protein DKT75_06145 [Leucothrix arctica]
MSKVKIGSVHNSNIVVGNVQGGVTHTNDTTTNNQQINEIALEIRKLIPEESSTSLAHMEAATKVIEHIENDRSLAEKIMGSLKDGSIDALGQALNHPAASFIIGAIKSWKGQS